MANRPVSKLNMALWFFLIYCLYIPVKSLKTDDSITGSIDGDNSSQNVLEEEPVFYQGVYGKPGVDFPILSHIPKTSFSCRELDSGYYADLQTDCQVFHICEEGKKISFLCPNGTIFQQSELICEWWFKVNCTNSPNLYEESAEQLREENARRKASRRVYVDGDNHGAIMRTEQHSTVTKFQKGKNFEIVSTSSTRQNQQYSKKFEEKSGSKPKEIKLEPSTTFGESPQYVNIRVNGRTTPQNQNQHVNIRANSLSSPTKVESNQNIRLTVSTKLGGTQAKTKPMEQNQTNNRQNKRIDFPVNNTNQNSRYFDLIYGKKSEPNQSTVNQITPEAKNTTSKQNIATYNEASSSEETQVPQESSSFYKSSFNTIKQSYKPTVHPNHRDTYSEIKEPQYYSTKIFSAISSVTPQYLTTQPINNGRPFVGSQVGGTNFNVKKITNSSISTSTTAAPTYLPKSSINNGRAFVGSQVGGTNFNVQKSTNSPITTSTTAAPTYLPKSSVTPKTLPSSRYNIPLDLEAPAINVASDQNKILTSTAFGPNESTTRKIDHATVYGRFANSVTPTTPTVFATTPTAKFLHSKSFGEISSKSPPTTVSPTDSTFYVTKNSSFTSNSYSSVSSFGYTTITTPIPDEYENFKFTNKVERPRPFKLSTSGSSYLPLITTQVVQKTTPTPTSTLSYPTYKVSSASPFSKSKQEDTVTTTQSGLPSTFENVDSMISALAEMAQNKERFGEASARPGLVVPPSAGPQTLHTLAVYFANALDGLTEDKEESEDDGNSDNGENHDDSDNDEGLSQAELEKKRLTALLTQMTMDRYNELFSDGSDDSEEATTLSNQDGVSDSDLEVAHTKNAVPNPKVRQLAKVFTQALSSYLDDPVTFRRVLAEVRPTEPPNGGDTEETPSETEDELLNFSDADVKSSFPPVFSTPLPSVKPTWGYLIAYNTSSNFDNTKNSISTEQENLQLADSQSFVSQFNKLKVEENKDQETTTKSSTLPNNHWTRSPDATKLWKSAFTFNPALINKNLETTTESIKVASATPESGEEEEENTDIGSSPLVPHHEIKYELRALPRLALNSTQVHGILIDFMNNTKPDEDNRLQRILRKLNTTEDEFLQKMKEIESNPLTKRLILLLISECGANATKEIETQAVPIHDLISRNLQNRRNVLGESLNSNDGTIIAPNHQKTHSTNSNLKQIVDPSLDEESEDTRALQLLNSLYTIASKFGK